MPKITVLPNPKYCPEGAEFEMATGENLIRGLLSHGVNVLRLLHLPRDHPQGF